MAIKPVEILINAKDSASTVFDKLKATAIAAGAAIAAYFGVRLFTDAVQGAAELEAKLSEVKAVSGATTAQMGELRKAAEEAGANTSFSATQAAEALGNLARAGLSSSEAIAALNPSLTLATAGSLDLGEASSLVTKILAGFGLQAAEAGRIADVLAQGANASDTSVQGLGEALSYAAPTAVSMGMSLESVVAIIGKFADAGIDASRAGTALNSILAQFSDPASKFRNELAAAGITTTEFEKALRQLEAAGPGGQKAIAAVGLEAGPALKALLNQGIDSLDELRGKLQDAAGSAQDVANTMSDNFVGATKGLASAWDTVKNALATPVLPVLRDGIEQLATSLRNAVQDGTVARFGSALATGFTNALAAAREFLAQVDFGKLAATIESSLSKVGQAFDTVSRYAQTTGDSVRLVYGTMSAGVNAVLAVVYKLGEAFALVARNVMTGLALLREGLAKISFGGLSKGFTEAANDARISAGAFGAAADALAAKATQAAQDVADGAETARSAWDGLTTSSDTAATQAATSAQVFSQVGDTLTTMGDKATQAAQETKTALQTVSTQAGVTQAEVTAAFERMGVQTKAALKQTADNALRDFDIIKASGQATSAGLAQAWTKYAEAAIAANGGVASETLKTQAAMHGLEIAVDATGKTIVRAMGSGKDAIGEMNDGIKKATQNLQVYTDWLTKLEKRNKEVKSVLLTDKDGFAIDSEGKRITQTMDNRDSVTSRLKSMGVDESMARQLAATVLDERGNYTPKSTGYFRNPTDTMDDVLRRMADAQKSSTPAAAVGRTVNVNITTPTGRETVATDEAGAAALVKVLQQAQIGSQG